MATPKFEICKRGDCVKSSPMKYRPLDEKSVLSFAQPFLLHEPLTAQEVGDGNLNLVFRVLSENSSIIIKQALPYLRVAGSTWPLTRNRARIEAEAIIYQESLFPGILPKLIFFDKSMSALVLEDLLPMRSWRDCLIEQGETLEVVRDVAKYVGTILIASSKWNIGNDEKQDLRGRFIFSGLCLLSEDLIFTAPFKVSESNKFSEELEPLVNHLQGDQEIQRIVGQMKSIFKTRHDALIHGDLHTGSVMTDGKNHRIIDLEFAFFGPFGFDPGLICAHLILARISHFVRGNLNYCHVIDRSIQEFWAILETTMLQNWKRSPEEFSDFLRQLHLDAVKFAGIEMVRRIIGLAHVKEIEDLPSELKFSAEEIALRIGSKLIKSNSTESFAQTLTAVLEEER